MNGIRMGLFYRRKKDGLDSGYAMKLSGLWNKAGGIKSGGNHSVV